MDIPVSVINIGKITRPEGFWILVFLVWAFGQIPMVGLPFVLLSTWVHELGHGLGAIFSGGRFENMIITPGLSGLAHTFSGSDFERIIVLLGGLLGPSMAGAIMLILSRRMDLSRLALFLLASALLATVVLWAGDMFTRVTVLGFGVAVAAIALWSPAALRHLFAHIIAIAFCLNAVAQFDYIFMNKANVGGYGGLSDTAVLAEIIGGPHIFWAIVVSILSLFILYLAFKLSGGVSGKRNSA